MLRTEKGALKQNNPEGAQEEAQRGAGQWAPGDDGDHWDVLPGGFRV